MAMLTFMSVLLSCADDSRQENDVVISDDISAEAVLDKAANGTETYQEIQALWQYYTAHWRFAELVDAAAPYFEMKALGHRDGDKRLAAMTGAYLAQAYLFDGDLDNVRRCLDTIENSLIEYLDSRPSVIVNNTAAFLALKVDMDYSQALHNFKQAFEHAVSTGDSSVQCRILCNIASLYYKRNDSSGFSYAKKAYDIARVNGDDDMKLYGFMFMSKTKIIGGEYIEAKRYADSVSTMLCKIEDNHSITSSLRLLYAKIYQGLGMYDRADSIYNQFALDTIYMEQVYVLEYCNQYGNFLFETGKVQKAGDVFMKGLLLSYEYDNVEGRQSFLLGLSNVANSIGDVKRAFEYYRWYHSFIDSMSFIQKERNFNKLLMSYDKLAYEQKIHSQEIQNLQNRRRVIIIALLMLLTLVVSVCFYILYKRKNQMYRELVERHQAYIKEMKRLKVVNERILSRPKTDSDEKGRDLFLSFQKLMDEDKVYRNKNITLDKVSEMLDTNRLYLSKAVNAYAGMSFSAYVNKKRIDEAVNILSDVSNDIPLKVLSESLGFNYISVFYRAFQKEVGCPPSKYREGVKQINS